MKFRGWWERVRKARRKRLLARRLRPGPRLLPRQPAPILIASLDDPIQARVDFVRFVAFAEAAAETMELGPNDTAREKYDEACLYFGRAIEAASRAGLIEEAAKVKARRASLKKSLSAELRRRPEFRKPNPPRV